jgi:hypothetical protein
MPTGYTHAVCEGKQTEFGDFAMTCARAFGALINMRDEPMDAPIPEEFKPATYNATRIAEATARLAELRAMTPAQAEEAAATAYAEGCKQADKYDADNDEQDRRVSVMEEKVRVWEPPTAEHTGLKTFMLEQLGMSKHGDYRSSRPELLTDPKWIEAQTKNAMRDLEYNSAEQAKEIERAKGRTAWVASLRASLQPST